MFTLRSAFQWWIDTKYFCDKLTNSLFEVRKLKMVVCAAKLKKVCKYNTRTRGWRPESKNAESCERICRYGFLLFASYRHHLKIGTNLVYRNWDFIENRVPMLPVLTKNEKICAKVKTECGYFFAFQSYKNRCTKRISRLNDLRWRHTINHDNCSMPRADSWPTL